LALRLLEYQRVCKRQTEDERLKLSIIENPKDVLEEKLWSCLLKMERERALNCFSIYGRCM
jgi:hypothetical protein